VLTALPTNLRTNLRAALADPDQASPALERLRDDVREAYAAMVSSLQVRNSTQAHRTHGCAAASLAAAAGAARKRAGR